MSEECIETRNGYFNVVNVESCTMKNVCIYVKHLEQENQQLKEKVGELTNAWDEQIKLTNQENLDCSKYVVENHHLKSVLDEIREYIDGVITIWETNPSTIATLDLEYLLQILDKVNIDPNDVSKMFKNCTTLEPFLEHMDKVKE